MEELRLTRPTEAMSGEISAYRQTMLDAGSEMDGCGRFRAWKIRRNGSRLQNAG